MGKGQKARLAQTSAASSLLAAPVSKTFVPGQGLVATPQPVSTHMNMGIGVARGIPTSNSAPKPPTPPPPKSETVKFDISEFIQMSESERTETMEKLFLCRGEPITIPSSALSKSKSMQSLTHDMAALTMKPAASVTDLSAKHKSSSSLSTMKGTPSNGQMTNLSFTSTVLDITTVVMEFGFTSSEGDYVVRRMKELITSTDVTGYEKGLFLLKYLILVFGRDVEAFIIDLIPQLLKLHMDRQPVVRDVAADVLALMADMLCPYSIFSVYETVVPYLAEETDWRVRVAALRLIKGMAPRVAGLISPLLPSIIPQLSECAGSAKKQVQTEAIEALTVACSAISNEDIAPIVPQLVNVIAHPDECGKTLDILLETTFVSTVDAPTLALITPLLGKSLRGRSSVLWRKAAKIIENMCRLVNVSSDVLPFVPLLLPALEKVQCAVYSIIVLIVVFVLIMC